MIVYLTSDPGGAWETDNGPKVRPIKKAYGFRNKLIKDLKEIAPSGKDRRCLVIASDADAHCSNDLHRNIYLKSFWKSGIVFSQMDMCDSRHMEYVNCLNDYDLVFLMGGHAPTQNKFFGELGLADKIPEYEGILLSLSAGSMNCAKEVYLMPEEPEDMDNSLKERMVPGLGLVDIQMVPHYQWIKHVDVNGQNLIKDVVFADSFGERFIAVCDDGYFRIDEKGNIEKYGEMYVIADGEIHAYGKQ